MEAIIKQEDRAYLTMAEGDLLPQMNMKIREEDIIEDCRFVLGVLGMSSNSVIYQKEASLKRNCLANDSFFDGSKDLDIWIECAAFDELAHRFVRCGAYLTDIWSYVDKNDFLEHMWVENYELKEEAQP